MHVRRFRLQKIGSTTGFGSASAALFGSFSTKNQNAAPPPATRTATILMTSLMRFCFWQDPRGRVNPLDAVYPCVKPVRSSAISDPSASITRTPEPASTVPIAVTGTSHAVAIVCTVSLAV